MNYIIVLIKENYSVYVQEDRLLEFTEAYFLDSTKDDHTKNMYLYDCIMEGWIKRSPA
jgi:hypothetical protein